MNSKFLYNLLFKKLQCTIKQSTDNIPKKAAFSLVEILVALIIVSLIIAAMAPVITKKLSSAGITIVGGGSGSAASSASCGDGTYWDDELKYCKVCSYKTPHCIDCNETSGVCSVCEDGFKIDENNQCVETNARSCGDAAIKVVLNGISYCMTKYNIGDHGSLPVASGTYLAVAGGTACTSGNLCCWQGTTASPCNSTNGEYSGCGRTVCNHNAAKASCKELTYNNMLWRLPSSNELTSLASQINTYSKNQGNNGLMLCDYHSGYGSSQCQYYNNCSGASDNSACRASNIWARETSSTSANYFQFISGILSSNGSSHHYGWSTRCISPLGECNSGEFYDINELTCKACSEKTLNCKNCDKKGVCTVCEDGYTLDPTTKICYEDICGKYALKVNLGGQDYCFAKYNSGDNGVFPMGEPDLVISSPSLECNAATYKCAWQHYEISSACDDDNGSYSGCARTLLSSSLAKEACRKTSYMGLSWRLPTKDELMKLSEKIAELNENKGDSGLMLCSTGKSKGISQCLDSVKCKTTTNGNRCFPALLWASDLSESNSNFQYYFAYASNITTSITTSYVSNAFGARCIAPIIDCGEGYYSDNTSLSCKTCDTKTLHCAKCNKRTGECSACKNGYTYNPSTKLCEDNICGDLAIRVELDGKEMCMTKYNIGDGPEGGEKLPIASSVSQRFADSTMTCDIKNDKCSWSGITADTGCSKGNEEYSGCTRTVMNWTAANDSCNALSYRGLSWRLPTGEELNDLKAKINLYVIDKGTSGLMFCAGEYYNGSLCPFKRVQIDASYTQTNVDAFPTELWGGVANNSQYYNFRFRPTFSDVQTRPNEYAFSVRCVAPILTCNSDEYADSASGSCKKCSLKTPNCKECALTNGGCSACQEGWELKDGACVQKARYGEPRNQIDCDPYNAKFIDKKYNGDYGKNVCVTNVVVGYHYGPKVFIGSDESKIMNDVGTQCSHTYSAACCWKGNVSTDYYTTVCGYSIALSSCLNYLFGSGTSWSLPSEDLVNGWIEAYNGNISLKFREYIEATLCTNVSVAGKRLCDISSRCIGAKDNSCVPARNWALGAKTYELTSDALVWMPDTAENHAVQARCVSSEVFLR